MTSPRISRVCWNCGSDQYRKLKSIRLVTFGKDRECTQCQVCYRLPTPMWAKLTFLLLGAATFPGCAVSILIAITSGNPIVIIPGVLFGILGFACLKTGVVSLFERDAGKVDYSKYKDLEDSSESGPPAIK